MRADLIVLPEPRVDDDLGLLGRREPLGIENLGIMEEVHHAFATAWPLSVNVCHASAVRATTEP